MKKLLIIAIGFLYPHVNWSMSSHYVNNDSLKRTFMLMTSGDMANYRPGNNDLPDTNQSNAISIENESLESDNATQDVNAKTFPCPYPECKEIYSEKQHLNDHIAHKHLGKGYACTWPDCTLTFEHEAHLMRHMRTHTREKPYQCEHCAYKCSRNDSLNSHMRTHTGEKPYACEYCSYKCSRSDSLNNHVRTHTGEKPYVCEYCSYKCSQNYHLNRHKKACKAAKLAATQILLSIAKAGSTQ